MSHGRHRRLKQLTPLGLQGERCRSQTKDGLVSPLPAQETGRERAPGNWYLANWRVAVFQLAWLSLKVPKLTIPSFGLRVRNRPSSQRHRPAEPWTSLVEAVERIQAGSSMPKEAFCEASGSMPHELRLRPAGFKQLCRAQAWDPIWHSCGLKRGKSLPGERFRHSEPDLCNIAGLTSPFCLPSEILGMPKAGPQVVDTGRLAAKRLSELLPHRLPALQIAGLVSCAVFPPAACRLVSPKIRLPARSRRPCYRAGHLDRAGIFRTGMGKEEPKCFSQP